MLRVEVCDGARTCVEVRGVRGVCRGARRCAGCAEVRGVRGGAWRRTEVHGGGEPTGFSAYGVHKSLYLQNKSFLAS